MRKKFMSRVSWLVSSSLMVSMLGGLALMPRAYAQTPPPATTTKPTRAEIQERLKLAQEEREAAKEQAEERKAEVKAKIESLKAAKETKLADAKLKSCQNREKSINNIMQRIGERGEKQMAVFDAIATRAKAFYTEKGLTADNYEALVASSEAKKTAAQAAVDAAKAASVEFKCDGTDPKGFGELFKTQANDMTDALKEYKTAVKDLVQAIHQAAGATDGTEETETGGEQ